MAYIVGTEILPSETAYPYTCPLPPHQAGDLLVVFLIQRVNIPTTTPTGWTALEVGIYGGVGHHYFYKIAASSSETDPVFSSGSVYQKTGLSFAIRGVDQTTPINTSAVTDYTGVSSATTPALTTTADNCLLLFAGSNVGSGTMAQSWVPIKKVTNSVNLCIGKKVHHTAGAIEQHTVETDPSNGGKLFVVAINNDASCAYHEPSFAIPIKWIRQYSESTFYSFATPDSTGITAISSVPVDSNLRTYYDNVLPFTILRAAGFNVPATTSASPGLIQGVIDQLPASIDVSGRPLRQYTALGSSIRVGSLGPCILVLQDSNGAWVAYNPYQQSVPSTSGSFTIYPGITTPLDSGGGAIDFTDIDRIGLMTHEAPGNTSNVSFLRHLLCIPDCGIVGGSPLLPITADVLDKAIRGDGNLIYEATSKQGTGQLLITASVQFGDGTNRTIVAMASCSIETPASANPYWNGGDNVLELRIKASANCSMDFSSCLIISETVQDFVIDPASSTSAYYSFAGTTISGWAVTWKTGVDCDSTIFKTCKKIDGKAASFSLCRFIEANDTAAIAIELGAEINDCTFISSGSGHAIEITETGTYVMDGNTFSGYGTDDSTDAVIYNSSGGAVTIQISNMSTPTVRNSSGSTTTIAAPETTLTLTGLKAGSEVRAYVGTDPATAVEIDGVESSGTSFTFSHEEGGNDGYIVIHSLGYESQIIELTYSSSDQSIPVSQRVDRWYSNPT